MVTLLSPSKQPNGIVCGWWRHDSTEVNVSNADDMYRPLCQIHIRGSGIWSSHGNTGKMLFKAPMKMNTLHYPIETATTQGIHLASDEIRPCFPVIHEYFCWHTPYMIAGSRNIAFKHIANRDHSTRYLHVLGLVDLESGDLCPSSNPNSVNLWELGSSLKTDILRGRTKSRILGGLILFEC